MVATTKAHHATWPAMCAARKTWYRDMYCNLGQWQRAGLRRRYDSPVRTARNRRTPLGAPGWFELSATPNV
ncbi:hypothetical protein Ntsu_33780 [Nocardia sp. IFM 10818]